MANPLSTLLGPAASPFQNTNLLPSFPGADPASVPLGGGYYWPGTQPQPVPSSGGISTTLLLLIALGAVLILKG
jgi:hypothetical protein